MLVGLCGAGQKLWLQCAIFTFLLERQTVLILFALSFYTDCLFFLILADCFKYQKYGECSEFQTDSVFDAQFACFDETIDLYQWIKP